MPLIINYFYHMEKEEDLGGSIAGFNKTIADFNQIYLDSLKSAEVLGNLTIDEDRISLSVYSKYGVHINTINYDVSSSQKIPASERRNLLNSIFNVISELEEKYRTVSVTDSCGILDLKTKIYHTYDPPSIDLIKKPHLFLAASNGKPVYQSIGLSVE